MLQQIFEVVGALATLFTAIAQVCPKGTAAGRFFAKYGADLKGHLQ